MHMADALITSAVVLGGAVSLIASSDPDGFGVIPRGCCGNVGFGSHW